MTYFSSVSFSACFAFLQRISEVLEQRDKLVEERKAMIENKLKKVIDCMGCRKNPNKNGRVDSWQVHQCCWPWVTPDVLLLLKLANNSLVNNSELYTL